MKNLYLSLFLGLVTVLGAAQCSKAAEPRNLAGLLDDAQYALLRYQELDTVAACNALPSNEQGSCKQARRAIISASAEGRAALRRGAKNPKASDLAEIVFVLTEVAGRLEDMEYADTTIESHDASALTTQIGLDNQYTEASGKTTVLAARIMAVLRERLRDLETGCVP